MNRFSKIYTSPQSLFFLIIFKPFRIVQILISRQQLIKRSCQQMSKRTNQFSPPNSEENLAIKESLLSIYQKIDNLFATDQNSFISQSSLGLRPVPYSNSQFNMTSSSHSFNSSNSLQKIDQNASLYISQQGNFSSASKSQVQFANSSTSHKQRIQKNRVQQNKLSISTDLNFKKEKKSKNQSKNFSDQSLWSRSFQQIKNQKISNSQLLYNQSVSKRDRNSIEKKQKPDGDEISKSKKLKEVSKKFKISRSQSQQVDNSIFKSAQRLVNKKFLTQSSQFYSSESEKYQSFNLSKDLIDISTYSVQSVKEKTRKKTNYKSLQEIPQIDLSNINESEESIELKNRPRGENVDSAIIQMDYNQDMLLVKELNKNFDQLQDKIKVDPEIRQKMTEVLNYKLILQDIFIYQNSSLDFMAFGRQKRNECMIY